MRFGGLMVYEITRDLPLEQIEIETPVAKTKANVIAGKKMHYLYVLVEWLTVFYR